MRISQTAHGATKRFSIDNIDLPRTEAHITIDFQQSDYHRTGTSYMHFKRFVRR